MEQEKTAVPAEIGTAVPDETKDTRPGSTELEKMFEVDEAFNFSASVEKFLDAEKRLAEAEDRASEAKRIKEQAEAELVLRMGEQGLDTIKLLGYSFSRKETLRASVLKENQEQQFDWLQEIGHGDAIKPTVHPSTFSSIVKERLSLIEAKQAEADPLPDWVKIYTQWSIQKRRAA